MFGAAVKPLMHGISTDSTPRGPLQCTCVSCSLGRPIYGKNPAVICTVFDDYNVHDTRYILADMISQ